MARSADVCENPVTRDRAVILRTAAETHGEVLEYEVTTTPRGFFAREHVHPKESERHAVLEGPLGLELAGERHVLGPGDELVVPMGTRQRVWSETGDPVGLRIQLGPALESEALIETFAGLARGEGAEERLPGTPPARRDRGGLPGRGIRDATSAGRPTGALHAARRAGAPRGLPAPIPGIQQRRLRGRG